MEEMEGAEEMEEVTVVDSAVEDSAAVSVAGSAAGSAAAKEEEEAKAEAKVEDLAFEKEYPPSHPALTTMLSDLRYLLSNPRSPQSHLASNSPLSQIKSPVVRQPRFRFRLSPRTTSPDTELSPKTSNLILFSPHAC